MAIIDEYTPVTWKKGDKLKVSQMNAISKVLDAVENDLVALQGETIPQLEASVASAQSAVEAEASARAEAIAVAKNEVVEQLTNGLDNDTIDGIKEVVKAYQEADEGIKTLINTNSGKISSLESEMEAVKADVAGIVVPDVSEFAKIAAVTEQIDSAVAPVNDAVAGLSEEIGGLKETAVSWVDFEYEGQQRKTIQLPNYDSISGIGTDGKGYNLAMLSKWNVADFGSKGVHANINTADALTVNDTQAVATVSVEEAQAAGSTAVYLRSDADARFALKSEIPSVEGFATVEALAAVEAKIPQIPSHDAYALKSELPTKLSELENDSGFLTEHQSLEGLAAKEDLTALDGQLLQRIAELGAESEEKFALKTSVEVLADSLTAKIEEAKGGVYTKEDADAKFALKTDLDNLVSYEVLGGYLDSTVQPAIDASLSASGFLSIDGYNADIENREAEMNAKIDLKANKTELEGLATEQFVTDKISALIDGAPEALNTLKEIADELNKKENADTVTAIVERITALEARIAELEAKVGNPATPEEDEPATQDGE